MNALTLLRGVQRPASATAAKAARHLHFNAADSASDFPSRLAFAFDIDGVLKQGPNTLPQARRTLAMLAGENRWKRPIPYLLITNGGGHPDGDRRRMLSADLGQKLTANQLVQSHTPISELAQKFADKDVLVVGGAGDNVRQVALSYGLKHPWIPQDIISWNHSVWPKTTLSELDKSIVRKADFSKIQFSAIFVMHDSNDWGRDATIILELLESKGGQLGTRRKNGGESIPLTFSNPDIEWKSDYVLPRLGQGAFRLAIEAIYKETTGKNLPYIQYGKPHACTYDFAQHMLERHLKEMRGPIQEPMSVYMIGDNPESDIAGANAHGWNSVLLRTGVYEDGTMPSHKPTYIADDVEHAVNWAIERESKKCLN